MRLHCAVVFAGLIALLAKPTDRAHDARQAGKSTFFGSAESNSRQPHDGARSFASIPLAMKHVGVANSR